MELGLFLIFWYGVLHAFGPDHLTAIANFSIGKSKKKTLLVTLFFAFGHGLMLFIFAKILENFIISDTLLGYGDIISSSVIIIMGLYLLYMALGDKIFLNKHIHEGKEHIHISFYKEHTHNTNDKYGALSLGALMGIGGVRGMLITLSAIENAHVDFSLIMAFVLGVSVVFMTFGYFMYTINRYLLSDSKNLKSIFSILGLISLGVGFNMILY